MAKIWSARAGVASRNRVSAPLNSPAYRTSPVEKTSIPPRVKNMALNRSWRMSPDGMFSSRSRSNP